jgi:hypothetical protein
VDDFFAWVHASRDTVQGRNLATKALGYALNQERELRRVLDDPSLPLDNTRAERALRKIVVGRKNWLFYGSDAHAEAAAAIFSILASCRLHRIDPFSYMDEVLHVLGRRQRRRPHPPPSSSPAPAPRPAPSKTSTARRAPPSSA